MHFGGTCGGRGSHRPNFQKARLSNGNTFSGTITPGMNFGQSMGLLTIDLHIDISLSPEDLDSPSRPPIHLF
jgi:hypothetical protein